MMPKYTVNIKRSKYTEMIAPVLLTAAFIIIFYPVLSGLVNSWSSSEEYSHGFFIFPLSLFIVWQKRERLVKIQKDPSWYGVVIIVFFLLLYIVSQYAEMSTLGRVAMIFVLFGLVVYLYGFGMLKELIFPLCFLFFMVPVPSQIYSAATIPLQLLVSKISVGITILMGFPVFREGNVIHLPNHTLQVVEACSGLRSMVSLLTLSAIFGYFTLKSNILKFILFISGIFVALFVNIFRVVSMILAFQTIDFNLAEGKYHTLYGIFIFLLALLVIVILERILSIWDTSAKAD